MLLCFMHREGSKFCVTTEAHPRTYVMRHSQRIAHTICVGTAHISCRCFGHLFCLFPFAYIFNPDAQAYVNIDLTDLLANPAPPPPSHNFFH
jgi:hypothetical protein